MKRNLILILNLCVAKLLFSQAAMNKYNNGDPFCQMINTLYSIDAVSFESQVNSKNIFEVDTVTGFAKVMLKKDGTNISFLRIIPVEGNKELLYCNDSAWEADHNNHTMKCLGTDADVLKQNALSKFFSFTLFKIDTMVSYVEPFWRTIDRDKSFTCVSLDITDHPQELTDIRAEFTIGNSDLLPYKTLQESVYLKADKLFQEQIFSAYSFPEPEQLWIPEYFFIYEKDVSRIRKDESQPKVKEDSPVDIIFLNPFEFRDLSGNPYILPENGLIFLDLWYVGCAPCMKSAIIIEKLYKDFDDEVHFVSVNETDNDTAKINLFRKKMDISFPVLLNSGEKIAWQLTGTGAYPLFILLDAETHKVLWYLTGYSEDLESRIREAINLNH